MNQTYFERCMHAQINVVVRMNKSEYIVKFQYCAYVLENFMSTYVYDSNGVFLSTKKMCTLFQKMQFCVCFLKMFRPLKR